MAVCKDWHAHDHGAYVVLQTLSITAMYVTLSFLNTGETHKKQTYMNYCIDNIGIFARLRNLSL